MYISTLHIQGFKSFLNKTDFNFGKGITAVVGPNGCGKSNIVDAIRWILGEQKISVLRSTKKEDVIFNGSKNRKPLSFCEASMLIHNNRDILPIEYNDVEIARRLYRSGESEFYINKTQCRMKDIHNLFVDTGMSSNAYSVIELKMVNSILSHNADDRRHMFEEAAGINHYKQQRQAAIRKMDATRSDMERVIDIINEVKNTVSNLDLQMKRYERHTKLSTELKEMEIQTTQGEIQLIINKQLPIENKLNEIKVHHSKLSGQMNLDEILADEMEKQNQDQKKQLNTCQVDKSALENEITNLNSKRLVWAEKISGNDNQKLHFRDELDHCSESIIVIKKKIKDLKHLKEFLSPDLIARKKDFIKTERIYLQVSKKYENLQIDLQEIKNHAELKFLKMREEEVMIERNISAISEQEKRLEKIHNNAEKHMIKYDHSQAEINILQMEVKKYKKENANFIRELEKLKNSHTKAEDDILKKKNSLTDNYSKKNTLDAKINFYKNIIVTHEGQPEGVKVILKDYKIYPYVLGVLSDLIIVKEPYKIAVELVLGEFIHYVVVDSRKNAQKLIQGLNQRISVIALDSIGSLHSNSGKYPAKTLLSVITYNKKLDELLHILIGNVCILPKGENTRFSDEFDWVSETGRYFKRGYIFKNSGEGSSSIISSQQTLQEMKKEMQKLDKQINVLEKYLKKTADRSDSIRNKLQLKSIELDGSIKKLNEVEQRLTRQDYIIINIQESMREIKEEIKRRETQIIDMNISSKSSKDNIDVLRKEFDESISIQADCMSNLDTLRSKRNTLQQDVQDTRIKLMEIKKEKEGLDYRIQTFSIQDSELGERIEKYESDLKSQASEKKRLATSISKAEKKLKELSRTLESISLEKSKLESEYNKAYGEHQRLQSAFRERQKRKDEYHDTIRGYELKLAEGKNVLKLHRQRILDLYHENLQETILNLDDFDVYSNKQQIDKIQRSLERIGPVNMAVRDEYEQESERYDFLNQQYGDLEESANTLKKTIDELDGVAQAKFTKTFDAIKENFTKTFASFFDGGEGHLRLVGKNDPLESDIEIIARPPGKKTQTLQMLSAGEKALTAIALLFAIYLVKPSPFCILDEVDAPLDDSNINKFTQALREFSNRTQFIVVTHNKLTMEKADFMYGITQQEEGVSKIVSIKMKEEEIEQVIA